MIPQGLGEYFIRASVPSPVLNVLCAAMSEEELKPIVYNLWPSHNKTTAPEATQWPKPDIPRVSETEWLNKTVVDEVFGFGQKYNRRHPVFPKLPLPYNTILNRTMGVYVDSIYLLAASASSTYMLCSIRGTQTPNCSTEYHASTSGGSLTSRCDDPSDDFTYFKTNNTVKGLVWEGDYTNVASSWASSISLNVGISDGDASNARILTQLIPTDRNLDGSLPSIAEAIAVLAGCTLLTGSLDTPFVHYWNYSKTIHVLEEPQYQSFRAKVSTQDFSSGGTQGWQNIFYIILAGVFVLNVLCFYCIVKYDGLVTDFIEPQNLFGLTLNSPSSRSAGNYGGKLGEEQLRTSWFIKLEKEREHLYIAEGEQKRRKKKPKAVHYEMDSSPVVSMYSKLAARRTSIL